ncbi:N-glycosylase/DNA lyase [archaeon]|jgi:N-glycosylase/DNA lyase|nr:N-glycosylase/DNA lyase [archaeon]
MELVDEIEKLKVSGVAGVISEKVKSFGEVDDLFSELCFCLMTAGFRADRCIEIQDELGSGFEDMELEDLRLELKRMGHRFWPQRAERIFLARGVKGELDRVAAEGDRDWLVKNVKGLGMKESSHFLRNAGFDDVAIVDFHIVDLLVREGLIEKGVLNKKRYLEIEGVLRDLGKRVGLSLGELDLYLWYIETGKVLK